MIGKHIKLILLVVIFTAILYGLGKTGILSPVWAWLVLVIGVASVVGALYLMRRFTVYTLTRTRAVKKSGVINVRKEQARIDMITNIITDRSLAQRILNIGDLDIDTANDSNGTLIWAGLRDPMEVEQKIDRLRNDIEGEISEMDDESIYYGKE